MIFNARVEDGNLIIPLAAITEITSIQSAYELSYTEVDGMQIEDTNMEIHTAIYEYMKENRQCP